MSTLRNVFRQPSIVALTSILATSTYMYHDGQYRMRHYDNMQHMKIYGIRRANTTYGTRSNVYLYIKRDNLLLGDDTLSYDKNGDMSMRKVEHDKSDEIVPFWTAESDPLEGFKYIKTHECRLKDVLAASCGVYVDGQSVGRSLDESLVKKCKSTVYIQMSPEDIHATLGLDSILTTGELKSIYNVEKTGQLPASGKNLPPRAFFEGIHNDKR